MQKLPLILVTVAALATAGSALAAPPAPPPTARAKVDPAKLRDCEHAWAAQRIKKGAHRAFIRACVRHG
jgi:hypothetical protein